MVGCGSNFTVFHRCWSSSLQACNTLTLPVSVWYIITAACTWYVACVFYFEFAVHFFLRRIMYAKKSGPCILLLWGTMVAIFYINFQTFAESQTSKVSLLSNSSTITHCTTGVVIGLRPSVTTVSFQKSACYNDTEDSQTRKTSFKTIFEKKIWGRNKKVNFSGSGKVSFALS